MATIRLNNYIDNKLSDLIEFEKKSKSEIIKKTVREYYNHHISNKTPYESGKELFGRDGSNSDLSKTYRNKLKEKLNEKFSH